MLAEPKLAVLVPLDKGHGIPSERIGGKTKPAKSRKRINDFHYALSRK